MNRQARRLLSNRRGEREAGLCDATENFVLKSLPKKERTKRKGETFLIAVMMMIWVALLIRNFYGQRNYGRCSEQTFSIPFIIIAGIIAGIITTIIIIIRFIVQARSRPREAGKGEVPCGRLGCWNRSELQLCCNNKAVCAVLITPGTNGDLSRNGRHELRGANG